MNGIHGWQLNKAELGAGHSDVGANFLFSIQWWSFNQVIQLLQRKNNIKTVNEEEVLLPLSKLSAVVSESSRIFTGYSARHFDSKKDNPFAHLFIVTGIRTM